MTKLTSPDPKETLLLYTSASQKAVSAALVVERDRWHSQATTRLLHIRSSSRFQVALFGTLKDILCSHHGLSTYFLFVMENSKPPTTLLVYTLRFVCNHFSMVSVEKKLDGILCVPLDVKQIFYMPFTRKHL